MNFTFGIITYKDNENLINQIIDSIEFQNIPNYEIIVVGSCDIDRKNLKVIPFDESIKPSWITRKKNIITENSKYENIVYLHDYIVFENGWYEGQLKSGNNFQIRMDKIINPDGSRFRDWVIWPHNDNEMDGLIGMDGLIPYDLTHLSKYMYISGSYWIGKKDIMIKFPLNEELSWGESEDVEWSKKIREFVDFNMNIYSTVKIAKNYKYRVFNELDNDRINILKNMNNKLQTFNIFDGIFSHDNYSVAGQNSKYIKWDRTISNLDNPTFYSHGLMSMIDQNLSTKDKSYGIIYESIGIIPQEYESIEQYISKFNLVFTHSSKLLKKYPNTRWIPGGGIWIGGSYGLGEVKIHNKTKLCSMVTSEKRMCVLHNFRLHIADQLANNPKVDVFRYVWKPIYESLHDYMFSIVTENYQDDEYFCERLTNCFATGTIPIYLGATKIENKFNADGILRFNNIEELYKHIDSLTPDLYYSKMSAIKDNFERCKQYRIIEDYIFENYFKNI
jgi:hypothetical protein